MFGNLIGRFLLWKWRRGLKSYRVEQFDVLPSARPIIEAPAGLVGIWDLGRGRDPRFTVAVEDDDPTCYFVLRLSPMPDGPGGLSKRERVSKILLNRYEPNGRIEWEHLPTAMRRHVVDVLDGQLRTVRVK